MKEQSGVWGKNVQIIEVVVFKLHIGISKAVSPSPTDISKLSTMKWLLIIQTIQLKQFYAAL